jgi:hypothetical protein
LHGYWHCCMAITVQIGPALCKKLRNEYLHSIGAIEDDIEMQFSRAALLYVPFLNKKEKKR